MRIPASIISAILFSLSFAAAPAFAKMPPDIFKEVIAAYPPAIEHRGLKNAYYEPESSKLKGYVVIEKGGIPAERARYFISFEEYDYRGVVVDLSKDDRISTRRGPVYAYLQRGDVMAVVDVTSLGRTVYFKLMSADIYVPDERRSDKHFSRVTVMLGFKFPKEVFKADDSKYVIEKLGEWIRPFTGLDAAEAYANGLRLVPAAAGVSGESEAGKASKEVEGGGAGEEAAVSAEAEKLRALEEKIDAAKKQMEEAEAQMKELKKAKDR